MKKIEIYQIVSGMASILSLALTVFSIIGIIKPIPIYSYSITGPVKIEINPFPLFFLSFLTSFLFTVFLLLKK